MPQLKAKTDRYLLLQGAQKVWTKPATHRVTRPLHNIPAHPGADLDTDSEEEEERVKEAEEAVKETAEAVKETTGTVKETEMETNWTIFFIINLLHIFYSITSFTPHASLVNC